MTTIKREIDIFCIDSSKIGYCFSDYYANRQDVEYSNNCSVEDFCKNFFTEVDVFFNYQSNIDCQQCIIDCQQCIIEYDIKIDLSKLNLKNSILIKEQINLTIEYLRKNSIINVNEIIEKCEYN